MSELLATTLDGVCGEDAYMHVVIGPPDGTGWIRGDQVLSDPTVIDRWLARLLAESAAGHRDVAASYLAAWVADAVGVPLLRAVVGQGRGWPTDAASIWLHEGAGELVIDGLAVAGPLRVSADDPAAGTRGVEVVHDRDALRAVQVDEVVLFLDEVFAAIRSRIPFGVRGMWGSLADAVASDATWQAHTTGSDVVAAWDAVQPFIDALDDRLPRPLVRPRLGHAHWEEETACLTVRGTCCLYYKTVDDDRCTSCPLGDSAEQAARLDAWLGRELAGDAES